MGDSGETDDYCKDDSCESCPQGSEEAEAPSVIDITLSLTMLEWLAAGAALLGILANSAFLVIFSIVIVAISLLHMPGEKRYDFSLRMEK